MSSNFVSSGLAGINQSNLKKNTRKLLSDAVRKNMSVEQTLAGIISWLRDNGYMGSSALGQFWVKYGGSNSYVARKLAQKYPQMFVAYGFRQPAPSNTGSSNTGEPSSIIDKVLQKASNAIPSIATENSNQAHVDESSQGHADENKQSGQSVPAKAKAGVNWWLVGALASAVVGGFIASGDNKGNRK